MCLSQWTEKAWREQERERAKIPWLYLERRIWLLLLDLSEYTSLLHDRIESAWTSPKTQRRRKRRSEDARKKQGARSGWIDRDRQRQTKTQRWAWKAQRQKTKKKNLGRSTSRTRAKVSPRQLAACKDRTIEGERATNQNSSMGTGGVCTTDMQFSREIWNISWKKRDELAHNKPPPSSSSSSSLSHVGGCSDQAVPACLFSFFFFFFFSSVQTLHKPRAPSLVGNIQTPLHQRIETGTHKEKEKERRHLYIYRYL